VLNRVVLAVETSFARFEERVDDLNGFGEAGVALVGGESECSIVGIRRVACADSEDISSTGYLVDRLSDLRRERWCAIGIVDN
jgi:hypothetical protein